MLEAVYTVESQDILARKGILRINNKTLATPTFWLRSTLSSKPEPWKYKDINTIVTSVYPFLSRKNEYAKMLQNGIHEYFGVKESQNFVMLDAGGFTFHKCDAVPLSVTDLLNTYEKSRPDIGVALEHSLNLSQSKEENDSRIKSTMHNIRAMSDQRNFNLMPVALGYSPNTLEYVSKTIKKTIQENGKKSTILGVGSIIPFIKTKKRIQSSYIDIWKHKKHERIRVRDIGIHIIATIRKAFPNVFLHCFGVGGSNMMHILFYLGVDSVDSIGWRIAAGYGSVEVFGKGQRYISDKRLNIAQWAKTASPEVLKALDECQCPVCKEYGLEGLKTSFHNRAIHSAFVYYQEAKLARKLISEGKREYEKNLIERFKQTRLRALFNRIREEYTVSESLDGFT